MSRRGVLPGLVALFAVASVASRVPASDQHVTGPEASLAARAAIAYVGGRFASLVRPGAPGVAWQFHVLRRDGSMTDVLLDEHLELIDVGDSPSFATGFRPHATSVHLAQATPPKPTPVTSQRVTEGAVSRADHDRAAKAALDATGGGRVIDVDRGHERGARWEVEVVTHAGRTIDVLLDANFKLIDVVGEDDAGEPAKPSGHDRDSRDD